MTRQGLSAFLPAVALVWAGVGLGGSLVAAPAKFTVHDLDLSTALAVGRAQFLWVARLEAVLAALAVAAIGLGPRPNRWHLVLLPIAIFAAQHLLIMPALSGRTSQIIDGLEPAPGFLHAAYVVLEAAKVLALCVAALAVLERPAIRQRSP